MKMIKKLTTVSAAIIMLCSSVLSVNAANYNLHYHRYATSNVTEKYLYVGTATQSGRVDVWNYCTKFNYATNVKTIAQVYCSAPQGNNYYNVKTIYNYGTGNKTGYGFFPYVSIGNTLRNYVELTYNSASYYTQEAEGDSASY